jgi:hypothetical protein
MRYVRINIFSSKVAEFNKAIQGRDDDITVFEKLAGSRSSFSSEDEYNMYLKRFLELKRKERRIGQLRMSIIGYHELVGRAQARGDARGVDEYRAEIGKIERELRELGA